MEFSISSRKHDSHQLIQKTSIQVHRTGSTTVTHSAKIQQHLQVTVPNLTVEGSSRRSPLVNLSAAVTSLDSLIHTMSSSSVTKFLLTPSAKASIERLKYEIFGTLPQLNTKTGFQAIKRMHRGAYVARYYPEPIEKFARMVSGWTEMSDLC